MVDIKIVDRSAIKPTYLIVAEDSTIKGNVQYYMAQEVQETGYYLEFRGFLLPSKTKAEQLTKDPYAVINTKTELTEISRKIPWQKIVRMDHVTYKIPQGKKIK